MPYNHACILGVRSPFSVSERSFGKSRSSCPAARSDLGQDPVRLRHQRWKRSQLAVRAFNHLFDLKPHVIEHPAKG
jgi:hypothetical protein